MATQAEIAGHLDLSPQAVSKFIITASIPKGRAGYDLDEVRIAYIRRLREMAAGRSTGGTNLADERARLHRLQADSVETKNKLANGELVHIGEVERGWQVMVTRFRARIIAIAPKVAPLVIGMTRPADVQAKIMELHYEALAELASGAGADDDTAFADDSAGDATDLRAGGTTAEPDGQPVGGRRKGVKPGGQRRAGKVVDRKG